MVPLSFTHAHGHAAPLALLPAPCGRPAERRSNGCVGWVDRARAGPWARPRRGWGGLSAARARTHPLDGPGRGPRAAVGGCRGCARDGAGHRPYPPGGPPRAPARRRRGPAAPRPPNGPGSQAGPFMGPMRAPAAARRAPRPRRPRARRHDVRGWLALTRAPSTPPPRPRPPTPPAATRHTILRRIPHTPRPPSPPPNPPRAPHARARARPAPHPRPRSPGVPAAAPPRPRMQFLSARPVAVPHAVAAPDAADARQRRAAAGAPWPSSSPAVRA
jgi:hypothetical protein